MLICDATFVEKKTPPVSNNQDLFLKLHAGRRQLLVLNISCLSQAASNSDFLLCNLSCIFCVDYIVYYGKIRDLGKVSLMLHSQQVLSLGNM